MNEYLQHMEQETSGLMSWDSDLNTLIRNFERSFDVILFGGVVRDILFNKVDEIRDIDIVLCPSSDIISFQNSYLDQMIRATGLAYKRNQFGGYKVKTFYNDLDVWLLKDTWAFREKLLPVSVENLLCSVYLNIDAYAWDCNKKKFVSQCNIKRYEEIDIVLEKSRCEALNLIRAVVLSRKYEIPLSHRIAVKLIKIFKDWEQLQIERIQLRHYEEIMIKKEDLYSMLYSYSMEELK